MPYNCKGDLYKREIVNILQNMGFDVKSVNALNKIMERMGLLIHYGNGWGTTDKGAKFSMWHKGVLNSDAWHPGGTVELGADVTLIDTNALCTRGDGSIICHFDPSGHLEKYSKATNNGDGTWTVRYSK